MTYLRRTDFKILLGGYINVNVIDGSAFFLSGFAGMCARHPYIHIDLVTANPVRSWEVLDELAEYSNVEIIDPYSLQHGHPEFLGRSQMSKKEYASVLADIYQRDNYDSVLIRDNEVALEFLKIVPQSCSRTFAYVTGLAFLDEAQDESELQRIKEIVERGGHLVCQTEEIKGLVQSNIAVDEEAIVLLPPHVPDPESGTLLSLEQIEEPYRLVYTGKFFKDWKVDSILAGVKAANVDGAKLHLSVAGDQFRHDESDPYFVDNVSYLLKNTEGVRWHGRVPRNVSRALISGSHVGIGWRSERLEASSELSTKILEYGALGRPSILNRTPMHERLLGTDYPLFVNSMDEFRDLLRNLRQYRTKIILAARKCYDLAGQYSYSTVSQQVLPKLGNVPDTEASISLVNGLDLTQRLPTHLKNRKAHAVIRGLWVEFFLDNNAASTVGQLALVIEKDFLSWQQSIRVTRRRIEALAKSDNLGELGQKNLSVRMESQDFESIKALRQKLEEVTSERDVLAGKLEKNESELNKALQRESYWREHSTIQTRNLKALRESKLGRLQTKIWGAK